MKHILLIMTDQQRGDYVGYLPNGKAVMPHLDTVAASAHFTHCNTVNPICTPARTALITGRYSRQIGTLTMAGDLFPQIPTFMQALQRAGYTTYGIGKFHYLQTWPWSVPRGCGSDLVQNTEDMKAFGYDYIWETSGKQQLVKNYCHYCHYLNQKGMLDAVRDFSLACGGGNGDTADHNYDKALPWAFEEADYIDVVTGRVAREQLARHPADRPFFMKVSFCGPHKPYDAPQRYLDQFPLETKDDFILPDGQRLTDAERQAIYRQRRSVQAMLKLIDDQIGEIFDLLRARGMFDDTLILFTSDHGDMLGDHYMIQKGVPWRQACEVPLAIRLPHAAPVGRCEAPVELTDLTATILDYAGLDPQEALSRSWPAYNDRIPARSLLPILHGEIDSVRDYCYLESDFTEERAPGTDLSEVIRKRGAGRTNAWRAIVTRESKYIRYVDYAAPGQAHEEFYDLTVDPNECVNRIGEQAYAGAVQTARDRMLYVVDRYPAAQLTWAKVNASARRVNPPQTDYREEYTR